MPENATDTTKTPEAPEVAEPTLEQELESLKAASQSSPEPSVAPIPEPDLETKLAAIEDKPIPEGPKLSTEQQQILSRISSPQALEQVTTAASHYQFLDNAIASRNFQAVEEMWDPTALEDFKEYLYQKHVASGEWVDRWIADKEGNPTVHRGMQALEQKIQRLEAQLAGQHQAKIQQEQIERTRQTAIAYTQHLNSLLDKVGADANDREDITLKLNAKIGSNPQVLAAINSGNMIAINALFKEISRGHFNRTRAITEGRDKVFTSQEQRKPLIQSMQQPVPGELPDDINQVPKNKYDEWEAQQFAKLEKIAKGRR